MGTKTSIMKEITLKEWSAYLPYKTKFQSYMDVPFEEMEKNPTWILDGINRMFGGYCLLTAENSDAYSVATCKPILRDLDLTKEIEHNGEKFVPVIVLAKTRSSYSDSFPLERAGEALKNDLIGMRLPYDMVQKLLLWHFNVFQISDELIVRVTEDFNPYK